MKLRTLFQSQALLAAFFSCSFVFVTSTIEFQCPKVKSDTAYELAPPFFKLITFGFWPAAVDALWIKTLQFVGDRALTVDDAPAVIQLYRLAQSLDPFFFETYEEGSIAFAVLLDEPDLSIELLDRGIQVFESGNAPPKVWKRAYVLYLYRAYVHGFLKNDFVATKKDFLAAEGAPGAPAYLHGMKVWLQKEGSEKRLGKQILQAMIRTTEDPLVKERLQEKLKSYE
jgi:hypothetical protein